MSVHPLIDLSNDRDVKQAKGFREAAQRLTGSDLAQKYRQELANAPKRHDASKKFLGVRSGKAPTVRKAGKDEEHLSWALAEWCRANDKKLALPRQAGELELIEHQVPLATAAPAREKGDADPNKGVGKIELLGAGPETELTVVKLKFLPPDATRGGTGDTPLRALLEGLAITAIAEANREPIQEELAERGDVTLSSDPPLLVLMASPRYWQLCRKREAQKGAAWIKEMERLAREVTEEIGLQIFYVGLELQGNPGWSYGTEAPALDAAPCLDPAWERAAGRVRPKAPPRPKTPTPEDTIIEPDYSRPVRPYALTERYEAGDRIAHPTLGSGVVQGQAGPGKILVRFDDKLSKLVHERAAPAIAQ